jgi:hypothetical protein
LKLIFTSSLTTSTGAIDKFYKRYLLIYHLKTVVRILTVP